MNNKEKTKFMSLAEELCIKNFFYYRFTLAEQEEFTKIAYPIISHPEFEKRCTEEFFHHDNVTLGEHIIKDALVTYRYVKIYNYKHPKRKVNLEIAVIIALFHDLYSNPWPNTPVKKDFLDKSGFIHPIEAVVNAYKWFPEYFSDVDVGKIIINGILFHMYPLPVRSITDEVIFKGIDDIRKYKFYEFIKLATYTKNKCLCFKKPSSKEGRIVSRIDKLVALKEIKGINSLVGFSSPIKNETLLED